MAGSRRFEQMSIAEFLHGSQRTRAAMVYLRKRGQWLQRGSFSSPQRREQFGQF
jgi:hypothetical protein